MATQKGNWSLVNTTATSPTLSISPSGVAAGDILVALCAHSSGSTNMPTGVSGGGVTWTRVPSSVNSQLATWIGIGTPSAGTVTFTGGSNANGATFVIYMFGGVDGNVATSVVSQATNTTTTGELSAALGQVVVSVTLGTGTPITGSPSGWATAGLTLGTVQAGIGYRIPSEVGGVNHSVTAARSGSTAFASMTVIGSPAGFADANFSANGTFSAQANRRSAALTANGTIATSTRARNAQFSASGTFKATPGVPAALDGEGSLSADARGRNADLFTEGIFFAEAWLPATRTAQYSAEGSFFATAYPPAQLAALEDQVLDKLVQYSVNTGAVPINPAEGSPGVPSLGATFTTRDNDPQVMQGEVISVVDDPIGTWSGQVVRVSAPLTLQASLNIETALSRLATDLRLFPMLRTAASPNLPACAVDYWTQQAGLTFDALDGDVLFYQSGHGHPFALARGLSTVKFYESPAPADTTYSGRIVKSFAGTSTTKAWDSPTSRIPVSVQGTDQLVCAVSAQVTSGTGTVTWTLDEVDGTSHLLVLSITSTTASFSVDGRTVGSLSASGAQRYSVSLRNLFNTTWVARLTAHNLTTSALSGDSGYILTQFTASPSLFLSSVKHTGGAGWRAGTSLTVADRHPVGAPAIQKSLTLDAASLQFVSGFEGQVWDYLNQFCSLYNLDLQFTNGTLGLVPRIDTLKTPKLDRFVRTWNTRSRWREVTVMDRGSRAVTSDVFWRSDSVYQVDRGETYETTVHTDHSILTVNNPVCVSGITPYPYKTGTGQYVVTGADGYIVSPQWWRDNGGKVEAFLTEREGEIRIKITAPTVDTVRAPYRLSEGAADRPALYITGSGVYNTPKEIKLDTGDSSAKEGSDRAFESPFLTTPSAVYETLSRIADSYDSAAAEADFECAPGELGLSPVGQLFSDGSTIWRVIDARQDKGKLQGTAVPALTTDLLTASLPSGCTVDDFAEMHHGQTIKEFMMKPLRSVNEIAP